MDYVIGKTPKKSPYEDRLDLMGNSVPARIREPANMVGNDLGRDCEAKPKLPWIDSTSFKKAAREAFGIQDELDRSLKRFEFPRTTPHSRSTAL